MPKNNQKEWFADPNGIWGKKYLIDYEDILPKQRTEKEVVFAVNAFGLRPGAGLLDLACGYGRHAISFAKLGYVVTGFDLSAALLRRAKHDAKKANVPVRWIKGDMRSLPFRNEFDAAVILFTSLGYFKKAEDNLKVVRQIHASLKPGGLLLIDMSNGDYLLSHFEGKGWHRHRDGSTTLEYKEFDPKTKFVRERKIFIEKDGRTRGAEMLFRVFSPRELQFLIKRGGFAIKKIWGGFDGERLSSQSRRIIILAWKKK